MVRTQSRPYGLCHHPYTKAHIRGFGSSYLHVYACLLLCFMLVLASLVLGSLVLGFAMLDALHGLDHVWLHPTPMRPCLDVTIWEAFPDARLLCTYPSLSDPCDAMLTMFVRAIHWLSVHLYLLAHMSMHESCLLVCHPFLNTMKFWTFNPNLHLSHTDTTFCLLSCLFAFLLICLLSCFFSYHVYYAYLLYASFICSLHLFLPLLVCWFLVFAFACTHMKRGHMGLGHDLLGASKKGEDASMWM